MEKMCNKLGITMSAAFNMFAKNLVNTGSINFSLKNSYKSGINYKYFFEKLSGDSKSIVEESEIETLENEFTKNSHFHAPSPNNLQIIHETFRTRSLPMDCKEGTLPLSFIHKRLPSYLQCIKIESLCII